MMNKNKNPLFLTHILLLVLPMTLLLSACGGQRERNADIPTEKEAIAYVEKEMGIIHANVLDVQDVRNKGSEYYEIDAVYTMTGDRGINFRTIRCYDYDTLFGTGYHYLWMTDYGDAVLTDYLKDHPLPAGFSYSEGSFGWHNYGASAFFGDQKQIWFTFTSDEEYEARLDDIEAWLNEWLAYERQYLAAGKDPQIRVAACRPKDDTMNYDIQLYRDFGYEKDTFHAAAADGETYRWSSFRKAMEAGYESQKKLKMK